MLRVGLQLAFGAATVAATSGLFLLMMAIRGSDACTAYALYKMRPPSSVLVAWYRQKHPFVAKAFHIAVFGLQ